MKVWITKYALTEGIVECDAKQCDDNIVKVMRIFDSYAMFLNKPDWWATKEEALVRVNQMKDKKIKSLKKQLEKLNNFEPKIKVIE